MTVSPIFRLAGSADLGLRAAEVAGLGGHAFPISGSAAGDLALIFVTAYLLHEVWDQALPIRRRVRAWWAGRGG